MENLHSQYNFDSLKRWILFMWWNLMPNDQRLMAESDTQPILRAKARHPDTLHLLDAEKEARKKNWDFQMKSLEKMR